MEDDVNKDDETLVTNAAEAIPLPHLLFCKCLEDITSLSNLNLSPALLRAIPIVDEGMLMLMWLLLAEAVNEASCSITVSKTVHHRLLLRRRRQRHADG
jgi:hypothetical protein